MSAGSLRLEPVEGMAAGDWNRAIARYDTAMFTHDAAWLGFLEERGRGEAWRFEIRDGSERLGYFAALAVRKGPFRILGSPLSATMSEYMGPIARRDLPIGPFLDALDRTCRERGIHQLELGSPLLTPEPLRARGYEASSWTTFRVPLARDERAQWAALSGKGRNGVRRARRNGLVGERACDPEFVDRHYAQVREVFGRQGLEPPFPIEDFRALFRWLEPQGLLFAVEVKRESDGEVLASGLFPHDRRRVYSLSTACWSRTRSLYPNELLHWSLMRIAAERGLEQYSLGDRHRVPASGGRFKAKWGGCQETVHRFVRHYSALARGARRLYVGLHRLRQRAPGQRGR